MPNGNAIAVDSSGAAYIVGTTWSTNFPTASPRQGTFGGGTLDAFVAKLTQPTVALGAATANVAENAGALNLTVMLSAASPVTVTVDCVTSNGTASAGSDYSAQSGTLTFVPNDTSETISFPIVGDLSDEPNETFSVALSNPSGARLGTPAGTTVTITDDDAPPSVAWQGANLGVGEGAGSALAPVVLSAPSAFTVTVNYATSNGTATADVPPAGDYTASSGTLTFPPGQTALDVNVPITNDTAAEPNETVTLTLSSPSNASLGTPNPATLTILDNDGSASSGHTFYQYDKLGNLLSKTGVGSYSYGANGNGTGAGPHQARSVGGQTYQYDANGNLLSGGGRSYTWDHENRPTQIISNTVTENYTYDGDGERISRASGGTTTIYLGGLWGETTAGAVTSYYTFNGATIAQRTSSGVTFLHGDHLGSVSVASGAGGASAGTQTFDPWGAVASGGIATTSINYTGQRRDSGTGLLYYHARYYDPILARFVSADTMTPDPSNPQDLNRYSYVHNNPIRYIDPTGHCLGWLWNDTSCRPIWETGAPPSYDDALDVVQTGLDVVGMVPAVGEAADLAMPASRPQEATRPVRRSRYHMAVGIQGMGIDRLQLER